ncbi:hypothetical protein MTO96_031464 [Rhipicephalus appendiculatus]
MLRGLSFEMGSLIYVLEADATSLVHSAYTKCTDFAITSRDVICGRRRSVNQGEQLLRDPYVIYATFLEDDVYNRVAFAEYYTSTRDKFDTARRKYGTLHHRSVWLLFNVHLGGRPIQMWRRRLQTYKMVLRVLQGL